MNKIQVGIVGMGYIGESHIEAVRRIGLCAAGRGGGHRRRARAEKGRGLWHRQML